jgi:serine/threonine-protein kinase HipA
MSRQLLVFLFGRKVGILKQEDGKLRFAYDAAWLTAPDAAPLSQSLPLRVESFDDPAARPFFAGLLPEGDLRIRLAKILQVSRQSLQHRTGWMMIEKVSKFDTLRKQSFFNLVNANI